ncbi:S41 family peptidase [Pseudoalteromonas lipolytica]|uniref:Carboxyl-terminal processing protease n=1 Tax=Pseudoalteromonas lipolytica TaxID=570156 RepID=A0ABY1GI66_9GAMM|nr:S41 family peptidase [Pseudoalteromonas lipolytica]MBE0350647.1 carboxyl-terminal processing protease [Pseudoalteromonas lipolytica LMEB 39]SFT66596.1 carboxyl-terminal processing protease [Pseudoalteromonas lipolytica]
MLNINHIDKIHFIPSKRFFGLHLILLLALLCLLMQSFNGVAKPSLKSLHHQQLNEILFNINTYYVDDLQLQNSFESQPTNQQVEALFERLDPYSKYLDETELDAIFSSTNGRYTGLGIEVKVTDGRVYIVNTIKNSPAEQAGLQVNDELTAINQQPIVNKSIEEVARLIRESGQAAVDVSVKREQVTELNFSIKRQQINLESVQSYLADTGVALLSINAFNNHTLHDVARTVAKMQINNGFPLSGLIIDLRDNPGGTLQGAIEVADLFLDSGTIVSTKGRFNEANQYYKAHSGDILSGAPIAVLINENSASAAEILAAALRDNQRATLVGETSFGKGSVQSLIPLGNGNTALKLTTARYYTPAGQSIDGKGIAPDVSINQTMLSEIDQDVIIKNIQGLSLFSSLLDKQDKKQLTAKQLIIMQ